MNRLKKMNEHPRFVFIPNPALRERIITITQQLFIQFGIMSISVSDISQQLSIVKKIITYRFQQVRKRCCKNV